ncbi:MAG: pitrilysin family protein [Planctomycetota bacterium]|nr:pitrilysin family protein [Planctomycetota bacterium]
MEFRKATLDNGLEIVAECSPRAYSTALGFFVKTGSRDESDQVHGVSHLLQFIVWQRTPVRTAVDVNRQLDEIGSHSNAFTSEEQTVYFAAFLPDYQDRALELFCDLLRPSLRQKDFDLQKQVALEAIAKYEGSPPFGAHEKCMAAHFGGHPLARSVTGTPASVVALKHDDMHDYFRQRYSPGNMVLVAAGNVDFDRLVRQTDGWCGRWEPCETSRWTPRAHGTNAFRMIHNSLAAQQHVVQIADGPTAEDEQRYAARLLATILGDSSGSRLHWELFDTGLAETAVLETYDYQGAGIFMTYLCCAPGDTPENLRRIQRIYMQAESEGVSNAELTLAKSKIRSHVILQAERPANRLFSVGNNWITRGVYLTAREIVERYDRVTSQDIADVLACYPLSTHTTVALGPLQQAEQVTGGNWWDGLWTAPPRIPLR